jgi:signal transduction histidine kinase
MAEELGNRASVSIENARLYKGSQDAITLRDDFISVASHELRTPITSIKMFTHVLKRRSKQLGDEKAVKHLGKMDKQLNKLTDLIYDLLNVSKIQTGEIAFKTKKFDFDVAVKEVIDVIGQSIIKHKLIVEGKTNKKVYGDEDRIGQVLNNLISNAVKYSPKAQKIIIKLSADINTVRVSVQDFGIGMSKQHHEKIFQRFYRASDTKENTFPGLGIGLYIAHEIIRRHGGKLWVKSNKGEGSTFSFYLPIKGV